MSRRRDIDIPKDVECPQCKTNKYLRGAGKTWRNNPVGGNPERVKYQQFICNQCGKIIKGNEPIKENK